MTRKPIGLSVPYRKKTDEPKREWVGLTDEERNEIESDIELCGHSIQDILKTAEAKLKEKNT